MCRHVLLEPNVATPLSPKDQGDKCKHIFVIWLIEIMEIFINDKLYKDGIK